MNRFFVAPMIDWTDRHCRYFHRLLSKHATLTTEMIVDQAVLRGDAARLLDADADKRGVVLQLGGHDPVQLAKATRIGFEMGYEEINLNCGCPSDRVQAGVFGAVLMKEPERVGDILSAMRAASGAKVSVKCRLGVDDQELNESLPLFLQQVEQSGVKEVIIHARKAWLQGLSPKENRNIPPLDYALAFQMKQAFGSLEFALNGGIENLEEAHAHLLKFDGVMLGRAAYHRPYDILANVDAVLFDAEPGPSPEAVIEEMTRYIHNWVQAGGRVHAVSRHMTGLFHGKRGGRLWRRILTERAKENDPDLLKMAFKAHCEKVDTGFSQ